MQHLGDDVVRCVAMSSTDGMVRGMEAENTGAPIRVPVGKGVLGRIFNVLGETVDKVDEKVEADDYWPIHRPTPKFDDLSPTMEILERALRSSTSLRRTPRAVKSVCSAVPASARPYLLWN